MPNKVFSIPQKILTENFYSYFWSILLCRGPILQVRGQGRLIPCNFCLYQLFFGFLGEFVILCHYICPPSSCKNCYYYTVFAISVNICRYVLLLFYFYAIDLPKQCLFFFYLKPSIRTITSVFLNSSTDLRRLLVEIKTTTTTFIVKSK